MCGILGVVGKEADIHASPEAMLNALGRRGPDDRGLASFSQGILGQTRLSIIDLASGHQPMRDEAQGLLITFNGEIYNYRTLRHELEQKGHHFTTKSDTEVILKAYAEYGEACPAHLDGMFAFAIWDEKQKQLFVARDRFGEKPFYYSLIGQSLVFASEIKAIIATGLVKPILDLTALDNYLALLYVPPWRTLYRDIHPLPPAHSAVFRHGTWKETRYWQLKKRTLTISSTDAIEETRRLIQESVTHRLTAADVEVGTFLSGGIDSSIVSAVGAKSLSPKKIKTFSAGFEDFINELPYAKAVAEQIKSDHFETQIKTDLISTFRDVSQYFDEPFADSSNIPTALIAQFARKHVKTILSGDGGDELFWGYGHYRRHHHLRKIDKLKLTLFSNPFASHKRYIQHWTPEERASLWKNPSVIDADPADHVDIREAETDLEKINLVDLYMALPGDMLTKIDRASMMHSLEVRAPFLSHKLAEFAYNLPSEYKTDRHRGKLILQDAFQDLVPKEVFTRKKQGFGAPLRHWLRKPEFKALVEHTLTSTAQLTTFLHWEAIEKMLASFYAGQDELQYRVWTLLSLELWLQSREHPVCLN
jgi:asparagine synthase (glutamine-hydrolysing)